MALWVLGNSLVKKEWCKSARGRHWATKFGFWVLDFGFLNYKFSTGWHIKIFDITSDCKKKENLRNLPACPPSRACTVSTNCILRQCKFIECYQMNDLLFSWNTYLPTLCTLYNTILRIARNFLETRENIKILTYPFYHINLGWFSWEWSKKKFFFFRKKNSKWPTQKKLIF